MKAPKVSVVMSVYNGQAFLTEAVDSVLHQTSRDFEFIIIDDGSSDATSTILSRYEASDGRVRLLRHENKGRAVSLNIGIGIAQGKYIARMDADDIALPNRLQEQVDFMGRNPNVGILGGAFELMDSKGRILKAVWPPLEDSEIRELMLRFNPICHPTVMMRKDVALAVGGYRKALLDADDYDLWLRMSERSKLANLGRLVLRYRIHADQVSVRNMRHQVLCVLAARSAGSARRLGQPDPLSGILEVTPQLVESLGVNTAEIERNLVSGYSYWIEVLGRSDAKAALRVIGQLLELSRSPEVDRSVIANAWLKAAGIHYRQGNRARGLMAAGRAVLVKPSVVGRPVKMAFARLASAFRGGLVAV